LTKEGSSPAPAVSRVYKGQLFKEGEKSMPGGLRRNQLDDCRAACAATRSFL